MEGGRSKKVGDVGRWFWKRGRAMVEWVCGGGNKDGLEGDGGEADFPQDMLYIQYWSLFSLTYVLHTLED